MLDVLACSPSVGSLGAEPLSVSEIDAHTDGDRIWATIAALRADMEIELSELTEAHSDQNSALSSEIMDISDNLRDGVREALNALESLSKKIEPES